MKWPIKEKKNEDYIYTGFALFPTRVQNYRIWLEKYYYFKVVGSVDTIKVKFLNCRDCSIALEDAIKNKEYII